MTESPFEPADTKAPDEEGQPPPEHEGGQDDGREVTPDLDEDPEK